MPYVEATPAIDAAGNALVVWESRSGDGGVVEAAARASAGAFGPAMALSSGPESYDPAVATSAAGETAVAWHGRSPDGENLTVRARVRPPGGSFGAVADLSPPTNDVYGPRVAVGPTGEAVVAWSPEEYDGTPGRSFVALRPPGGAFASPVMLAVKRQPAFDPTVVAGAGGAFAAVWTSPGDHVGIGGAIRPPGGRFTATALGPGGATPDVGVDGRGQAIAVWQLESESVSSVQAAGLDDAGRALRSGLPRLRGLRVAPARVRAARSGPPFVLGAGNVRYTRDAPARVVLVIERATSGRRSIIDTCDRPTRSNRRERPCVRYVPAGRQTLVVPGGTVRLRFSGRIAGSALAPGRYRLLAVPSIAGRRGNTARAVFSIVR